MLKLIKIFTTVFKDSTIRKTKIIFGLILLSVMGYNLLYLNKDITNSLLWIDITTYKIQVKYILTALGLIPIIMGITDICILKKKYMRIAQIISGIFLFYLAGVLLPTNPGIDFDFIIGIMGLLPLSAGITGKCITQKCKRYKEKIQKIRV